MTRRGRRKKYPHNKDIEEAIRELLSKKPHIHPLDFIDEVKKVLEEKKFYTGLVSGKRVWRIYEEMVRKGRIYDILGVVTQTPKDLDSNDYTTESK